MSAKSRIKKILPKSILNLRHLWYAWYGAHVYKHPSEEMLVIGVTGTSGKSTTIFLLRQMLEQLGYKVGSLSTIDFYIAGENKLNDQKMTMLGKMQIQKYLREMADKKCDIALVETTSEGAVQYRNRFINYDMMILTNLYPEHIESHGSFEKYKKAKLSIFENASKRKGKDFSKLSKLVKLLDPKTGLFEKRALVNGDIAETEEFLTAGWFSKRIVFGTSEKTKQFNKTKTLLKQDVEILLAEDEHTDKDGLHFKVENYRFNPEMYGVHNISNILITIAVARELGAEWAAIQKAVHLFKNAPGRCEFIKEAEEKGFKVIVDYAFEPKAMAALYEVVELIEPRRIIHVFGSTGGGRDVARRFTVGQMVGEKADVCIITDEDPYDDDPMSIINDVASAVEKTGKKENVHLFKILSRKEAIQKAIQMAQEGDLVLVTGKGSEQAMCVKNGQKIPWDDREEVRAALTLK